MKDYTFPRSANGRHLLQFLLRHLIADAADVERRDAPVLGRLELGHGVVTLEELLCHRVVQTVETILDVLVGQRVVRVGRLLVAVECR